MVIWSVKKHPYPHISTVIYALQNKEKITVQEYNCEIEADDICNFYGSEYIAEINNRNPNLYIKKAKDLSSVSDRYLINPFLNDLEKYLAKCDIAKEEKNEDDVSLLLQYGIHPYDLYLRSFDCNSIIKSWNINHEDFIDIVNCQGSKIRWSFNAWNKERKLLAHGDSRKFKYYTVSEAKKVKEDSEDLNSLLKAVEKIIDL